MDSILLVAVRLTDPVARPRTLERVERKTQLNYTRLSTGPRLVTAS